MKEYKKIACIVLSGAMMISLAACGSSSSKKTAIEAVDADAIKNAYGITVHSTSRKTVQRLTVPVLKVTTIHGLGTKMRKRPALLMRVPLLI